MNAVLCSVSLPLSEAQKLKPGDLIPLPPEALDAVEFIAGSGDAVAGGRLGQMNGMRAVRLMWPEAAEPPQAPTPHDFTDAAAAQDDIAAPAAIAAAPAMMPDPEPAPEGAGEMAHADMMVGLPDLPSPEFDMGDFSFDAEALGGAEGGEFDFDFAAAPMEPDES